MAVGKNDRPSAMRAARLLTVMAAVLALGSCQVLEVIFSSVFPGTVGLAKAQADLSSQIDASTGSAFHLRVVQSGSNGYVIVVGNPNGTGTIAYIYDLDLALKATLTNLTGDGVLVDVNGFIVIGDHQYNPVTLAQGASISPLVVYSNSVDGGLDGFSVAGASECYSFSFQSGTSTLGFSAATAAWVGSATIPPTFTSAPTDLSVDAVLDDGTAAGNVTLAVHQSSSGNNKGIATSYFLTTAKANYTGGSVPPSLFSTSPHVDSIATGCIGFAQGSIIAYDGSAGRFERIDPATGSVQSTFYSGTDMTNTRLGYLVGGGSFYGWNTRTRVLTKYAAWW